MTVCSSTSKPIPSTFCPKLLSQIYEVATGWCIASIYSQRYINDAWNLELRFDLESQNTKCEIFLSLALQFSVGIMSYKDWVFTTLRDVEMTSHKDHIFTTPRECRNDELWWLYLADSWHLESSCENNLSHSTACETQSQRLRQLCNVNAGMLGNQ